MEKEKPRLARLTAILTQLQSKSLVTASEIAKKHKVSIRTIYRDMSTLEKSGIPIVTEEGRGYSILEGYKLPSVMFTEEEANALITAEKIILKNKDSSFVDGYQSAITKIKSVLRNSQKEETELLSNRILIRANQENIRSSHFMVQLQSAITKFLLVDLSYKSADNEKSNRAVEPFALYSTQENWLLVAFCRKKKDFRAFRLDRIQRLSVRNEHFQSHNMTLEEYFEICRKKYPTTPDTPLS